MSRLRELIEGLCPDGVEYKALGEVGTFLRGSSFQKKHFVDEGVPCIHYGQVHTVFGISTEHVVSFLDEAFAAKMKGAKPGDLIIATTSEDDEAVGKATAWVGDCDVVVSNDAFIYRHALNPLYVSYFFASDQFQGAKQRFITGSKVRRLSGADMAKIRIPVPPIEIQCEIVRILDTFQELDESLTAEIEAREKQFDYSLEREFDETRIKRASRDHVDKIPLKCVRERVITPIRAKPTDFTGTIPWCKLEDVTGFEIGDSLSGKAVSEETVQQMGLNVYPEGTVLASCSATLGVYCITQKPLVTNQRFMGFVCGNRLHNRYLMYALKAANPRLMMQATTGTNAYISRKAFDDCLILVPEIELQERISNELDCAYEHLRSLRAERDARRKQFEHYRDKLLTFPEKTG